jgi:c-di-GMP-binding flagellar brake protein YcgR
MLHLRAVPVKFYKSAKYSIVKTYYRNAERMTMERRNYPRTKASIPLEFHVQHPEATEEPWVGRGVLANLSLTGIFFVPDDHPPLKQGDIRDFTFTQSHPIEGLPRPLIMKAKGRVVRIKISEDDRCLGVALNFLTGPYFS